MERELSRKFVSLHAPRQPSAAHAFWKREPMSPLKLISNQVSNMGSHLCRIDVAVSCLYTPKFKYLSQISECFLIVCAILNSLSGLRRILILRVHHLTQFLFASRLAVGATAVTGRAFWANRMLELPLPNMNTNACATMNCPLQPNVAQTYRYNLPVSRGFPTVYIKTRIYLWASW